jgi:hypothetical protein
MSRLFGKQLEAYLAFQVHGRKPPQSERKPPRTHVRQKRKGPARDSQYLAWIRTLPCVCGCERRPCDAAHTGTDGGMSMKASDYSCVPLCADCHTQAPGAYHRIGKRAFEEQHGFSFAWIVERLNAEWRTRCA